MNLITSKDLPQADRLESVLLAVIAVGDGARMDLEIASRIPGIEHDDRQGRYYRRAAEMLGFIVNRKNEATLTQKGMELLKSPALTNQLFIGSVLGLNVYQKLFPYLELFSEGRTKQEIESYLQSIADPALGPSMIPRRISTILAWLKALGLLIQADSGNFCLKNNLAQSIPLFEIQDVEQPILPITGSLSEYEIIKERIQKAKEEVAYFRDQAKLERSNNSHIQLVNLVAQKIRDRGGTPKSNQLIDLAVRLDADYLFEMKSTNDTNVRSQIRKGLSQLYEYRYLQNKPAAKLVLVVEKPLGARRSWMINYMEDDRKIHLIWDGEQKLFGTEKAKKELGFLGLQ